MIKKSVLVPTHSYFGCSGSKDKGICGLYAEVIGLIIGCQERKEQVGTLEIVTCLSLKGKKNWTFSLPIFFVCYRKNIRIPKAQNSVEYTS